jgi:nucleoside 2-deoxyribosyltransferase
MSAQTTTYDVFLSHSLSDAALAQTVERALSEGGLSVFNPMRIDAGSTAQDIVRQELAATTALVVVVSPQHDVSASTAVELGAAMAWNKAIYVVATEPAAARMPEFLRGFPTYPLSRLEDAVGAVRRSMERLSPHEQSILLDIYAQMKLPADRIVGDPATVDQSAREFNSRSRRNVPAERLVQELLRLRKAGSLPRFGR